jgi:hypothetical protein
MYIDGLTIAAMVVVAVALGMFIRGCIVHYCGPGYRDSEAADSGERHSRQ